jgi:hypothetical protein
MVAAQYGDALGGAIDNMLGKLISNRLHQVSAFVKGRQTEQPRRTR